MKFLLLLSFLLSSSLSLAHDQKLSNITSIDDQQLAPSDIEATDEALPYEEILKLLEEENFTILREEEVRTLFGILEKKPNARNKVAGGKCAIRRSYIQRYLREINIKSGSLLIKCPANIGHMKLIDQVTQHRYTFSNFHDVNIVRVPNGYNVMDVQFTSGPMTLSGYLAHVEASQKLKPLKNRAAGDKGYCYWSIK